MKNLIMLAVIAACLFSVTGSAAVCNCVHPAPETAGWWMGCHIPEPGHVWPGQEDRYLDQFQCRPKG